MILKRAIFIRRVIWRGGPWILNFFGSKWYLLWSLPFQVPKKSSSNSFSGLLACLAAVSPPVGALFQLFSVLAPQLLALFTVLNTTLKPRAGHFSLKAAIQLPKSTALLRQNFVLSKKCASSAVQTQVGVPSSTWCQKLTGSFRTCGDYLCLKLKMTGTPSLNTGFLC